MNEITCPKCNSSRLEIINGVICRCKECETIFKLDENDIAPTPEQKNEDEKMEAEKVISEKRPEKTWKCAYCGWEVPEGVEICPNCHRKSFERFFRDIFIKIALIIGGIFLLYLMSKSCR